MNECKSCKHFVKLCDTPIMGNCNLKREMVGEGYVCNIVLDDQNKPTVQQMKVIKFINSIMAQTQEYNYVKFEGVSMADAAVFIKLWHSKANYIYRYYIKPKNNTFKENKFKNYDFGEEPF